MNVLNLNTDNIKLFPHNNKMLVYGHNESWTVHLSGYFVVSLWLHFPSISLSVAYLRMVVGAWDCEIIHVYFHAASEGFVSIFGLVFGMQCFVWWRRGAPCLWRKLLSICRQIKLSAGFPSSSFWNKSWKYLIHHNQSQDIRDCPEILLIQFW